MQVCFKHIHAVICSYIAIYVAKQLLSHEHTWKCNREQSSAWVTDIPSLRAINYLKATSVILLKLF